MTEAAFCREENIAKSSFSKRKAMGRIQKRKPAFVELTQSSRAVAASAAECELILTLPGCSTVRWKAAGITVCRASLTHSTHSAIALLEPIYAAQQASVLESKVLAMNETPIRAGRKSKGKMRTAYFWPMYRDRDEVVFPYASSRAHEHVEAFFGNFEGTLLKAEDLEPDRSRRALKYGGRLYEIEAEIRERKLEGQSKLEIRGDRSRLVVAKFFEWLDEELAASALLPSNPFTEAANYARDRRVGLEVFLGNPIYPSTRITCSEPCTQSQWAGKTGCSAGRSLGRSASARSKA